MKDAKINMICGRCDQRHVLTIDELRRDLDAAADALNVRTIVDLMHALRTPPIEWQCESCIEAANKPRQ